MMKNSETCERAIEILEEKGWVKGRAIKYTWNPIHRVHNMNEVMGYCLMGAALSAQGVSDRNLYYIEYNEHVRAASAIFAPVLPDFIKNEDGIDFIEGWVPVINDHPSTTKEMIIDLATRAAKYWRDRGE